MCALIYIECTTLDLLQYGLCQVQCESRKISDLQWRQPEVFGHEFGFHPRVPKKYLDPSFTPTRTMAVVQRKIKRREDSLKETQSWVWQKGVIPHEEKDVTKGSVCLSDWPGRAFFDIWGGSDLSAVVLFRYLCRLRVFIHRFYAHCSLYLVFIIFVLLVTWLNS